MAKATRGAKKHNKITLDSLTERDLDILTLDTKDVMKKYKAEKQAVYDRRFALNKKIKQAGLTLEQLLGSTGNSAAANQEKAEANAPVKKLTKADTPEEEKRAESREGMAVDKQVPVIMKPIEINFDNFSVRLNGVPRKISVNAETNFIEIDL